MEKKIDRKESSSTEVRIIREDQHEEREDHSEKDVKVNVPVFGKLKYVDEDDSHGESAKAPITIVTAPIVSTAKTDKHKVGINQVVGEENCSQC